MKLNIKNIVAVVIIVLLLIGVYKLSDYLNEKEVESIRTELRKERIKNDTLTKEKKGLYSKLVADTLKQRQLKQRIDSLQLEVDDPKIVEVIKWKPRPIEDKEIDSLSVKDSTITITDHYPDKDNYFIRYSSKINTKTGTGKSDWDFRTQKLSLGIGQKKDGTFEVKTKVPDWLEITDLDVQSTPINSQKTDNFGILIGAGYGQHLTTKEEHLNIQAGIRYKKTYFTINATTINTINGTLTFEF